MVASECPFCNRVIEVKPPDKLHSAYSFDKPMPKSYYGKVIKKAITCPNPECRESITVYWYAPLDYSTESSQPKGTFSGLSIDGRLF